MKSLKIKNDMNMTVASSRDSGYFPSMSINEDAVPELADKEVGDTCILKVKVKITGKNADNSGTRINLDAIEAEYEDAQEDKGEDGEEQY